MLARHLLTAVMGEAAALLQMSRMSCKHTAQAIATLESGARILRRHGAAVFKRTIDSKPTQFLMPGLREHGITLESLAELYRQAALAGIHGTKSPIVATNLFETWRESLVGVHNPLFRRERVLTRLRREYAEAWAAVEDINSLQGLSLALQTYESSERSYSDLVREIMRNFPDERFPEGTCLAVFPNLKGR